MPPSTPQPVTDKLFANYAPPDGVFDEAVDASGLPRPAWRRIVDKLEEMGEPELRKRWLLARQQIDRDGVTFNPHGDDDLVTRPWELDAVPMVFADSDWDRLTKQLDQRSRLLDALLNDLFGEQWLLKDKILPPELLFAHPAWYPAYQNLYDNEHRYLTYCVTDLARRGDGTWQATGDRTRSPFGLGYVLENRIVTSRMLSSVFRELPIRRLAGFYAQLKDELRRGAPRFQDNPRIVLWSKGPQSRGYFEDSYLARYLGYTLAEGDDLAVRGDRVQLLTLGGLLPVEVILRRIDDDDCDSVELNPNSTQGISGLLDVLRSGRVTVANAVGSRLVESPAFLPYLPAIARHLLGEELELPSLDTWWCGEPSALEYAIDNLDHLLVRSAFRMDDAPPLIGRTFGKAEREALVERMRAEPEQFVAQQAVVGSTTPVLTDQGVVPWYVRLRVFSVATEQGYQTLPGGLARVAQNPESLNSTMTAGERSQDVWVLSAEPVEPVTLLEPSSKLIEPTRSGAELPSRVADNLFWLGRYAERAEQTTRLLTTLFNSLESESIDHPGNAPLLHLLASQGQIEPDYAVPELSRTLPNVMNPLAPAVLDSSRPFSLRTSIGNTSRTASRVRDRLSIEMWRAVDRLYDQFTLSCTSDDIASIDMLGVLENTLADLSALAGLVAEGMTRALGWRFLDLGRRLERCWQTTLLLKHFFNDDHVDDPIVLETLLKVTDSLMTYRSRYLATFQIPVVLDLLMTDRSNPRSLIYQMEQICEHLDAMPGCENQALLNPEQKLAYSMSKNLRLLDIYEMAQKDEHGHTSHLHRSLIRIEDGLPRLSDAVSSRFLIHAGLPRHFGSATHLPEN